MATWLTGKKMYEGFPLFLRRPADLDVEGLRPIFPTLVIVTHEFTRRKSNGLPEPDYNLGLARMDHELLAAFDVDGMGVPVLVETFGGKRHYYFYVSRDADVSVAISAVVSNYPEERLSWSVRSDPEWGFIITYAKEHF
jgi:hypothetical protein